MSDQGVTGHCFEDFEVGQVYRHPFGRTVTQVDNTWFTLLTMNTNELHFNADFASRTEHGRELVNSGLTLAIVLGLSVADISRNAYANLGWEEINLTGRVFAGDTLYAESVVTGVRASASRPEAGIVSCFTRGLNQDGAEIMTFRRSALVYKRAAVEAAHRFPEHPVDISARAGLLPSS
jgi:itaconyl-CoA hydratase